MTTSPGAKALLDKFGYVDKDGDGWRDMPDGKPLKLTLASDPSAIYRQFDELWKKSMDAVGIRIEFTKQKFPGHAEAGARRTAPDVGPREYQHERQRQRVPRSPLRPAQGDVEPRPLRSARVQRALRPREKAAQWPGAREALPGDVEARRRVRAVGAAHLPHREHHRRTRGSRATNTTRSIRIRGCTSTSISRSAGARRDRTASLDVAIGCPVRARTRLGSYGKRSHAPRSSRWRRSRHGGPRTRHAGPIRRRRCA